MNKIMNQIYNQIFKRYIGTVVFYLLLINPRILV